MKLKKDVVENVLFLIGIILMATGTSIILVPNQLSTGGFAGLATITYYLFNFPVGLVILILNIPLFILLIYKFGIKRLVKTIIGSVLYSIFIDISSMWHVITYDKFLACIYGGIIIGLGTVLVLKGNGNTGGTELIAFILKEYNVKMKIGNIIIIIDTIILLLNMIILNEIEIGLYSAISIYIMGKIIDKFYIHEKIIK